MDDLPAYAGADDDLLAEPMARDGWTVEPVPWRRRAGEDWSRFDVVVVRTTWDYQKDPEAFLATLEAIEGSGTRLLNPLELIRWNVPKSYLQELDARGIDVVPTQWGHAPDVSTLETLIEQYGDLVIKPVISASANDTYRLSRPGEPGMLSTIAGRFTERAYMAQPFMDAIVDEGEYSLFFFGGDFSHAVLKSPKSRDFRVQEEHGGHIRACRPTPQLSETAQRVMAVLKPEPLYARIDLVREGMRFLVMEVELIEPSLYLRCDPAAPARFVHALGRAMAGEPASAEE